MTDLAEAISLVIWSSLAEGAAFCNIYCSDAGQLHELRRLVSAGMLGPNYWKPRDIVVFRCGASVSFSVGSRMSAAYMVHRAGSGEAVLTIDATLLREELARGANTGPGSATMTAPIGGLST